MTNLKNKKIIIFDLDGTLTESKQSLDREMATLLAELMKSHIVAVIGGGSYKQFERQFIHFLPQKQEVLRNLFLFPASGTASYKFEDGAWKEAYSYSLSDMNKKNIMDALLKAEKALNIGTEKTYGDKIEDRSSQITYSGLGQNAPLEAKKPWDPDQLKRQKIVEFISPLLPGLNISIGGMTSIDITEKGINKAYGIKEIGKTFATSIKDMVFIGDALFPGGNDYPARETGIDCVEVKNPEETKKLIEEIVS